MAEPSKERIAAALALAEADCALATAVDGEGRVPPELLQARQDAIRAYRATSPKLRTRAEVDAERLLNLDAWRRNAIDEPTLRFRDERLAREETAPAELGGAPESEPDLDKPVCCKCGARAVSGITLGRSNGGPWRCTAGGCHRAPECEECAQFRERIRQLEAQAALYDQECGMCGSTFEELVEYGEWRNARLQLLSPGEHSPANNTERTTTP